MTGRGIDQILPHPSDPVLYEPSIRDARAYVSLAEAVNGEIPRCVPTGYIWGDALDELDRVRPDVRLVNLETSVTRSDDWWRGKGINYRMHPENVACLTAARLDIGVLANNHVLDWGWAGLDETVATLTGAGIQVAGAGRNPDEARRPACVELPGGGRLIVFGLGSPTSGIPPDWAATPDSGGIDFLSDLSDATAGEVLERVHRAKRPGDCAVASIHWGSNWGYQVPESFVRFAHRLVDGGVDLVHGHSSHHVRPMEVYRDRLILYGCGDLLNDYEGISGYEGLRPDLPLMYFPQLDADSGELLELRLVPMQIRKLSLHRPSEEDVRWLEGTLESICAGFGSSVELGARGSLVLRWRT